MFKKTFQKEKHEQKKSSSCIPTIEVNITSNKIWSKDSKKISPKLGVITITKKAIRLKPILSLKRIIFKKTSSSICNFCINN